MIRKWTFVDGAWVLIPAPPKDLPYFTRMSRETPTIIKEAAK